MIKLKRLLAAVLAGLALATVAAAPAQADDSSELPNCTFYYSTGIGPSYGGGYYDGAGDWYAYSPWWVVSSDSACEDVNITQRYAMEDNFYLRVRFAPSGGGTYANSWKANDSVYHNGINLIVATSVANGTWFRVEGHRRDGSTQVVVDRKFDVRF